MRAAEPSGSDVPLASKCAMALYASGSVMRECRKYLRRRIAGVQADQADETGSAFPTRKGDGAW